MVPTINPEWGAYALLIFLVGLFLRNFLMLVSNHDKLMRSKELEMERMVTMYEKLLAVERTRVSEWQMHAARNTQVLSQFSDVARQAVEVTQKTVEVVEKKVS